MIENKYVLAMYDVRGIQHYIYKTTKLKDAIGASAIIEDIIENALIAAVREIGNVTCNFNPVNDDLINGILPMYEDEKYDVQVLYIGGGNGVVLYSSEELCVQINKKMSFFVMENTYSLQLAVAYVYKTDKYSDDYDNLFVELTKVKAVMEEAKPLGSLPVMQIEKKTGYPISTELYRNTNGELVHASTESLLKKNREGKKRKSIETYNKKFETYVEDKGTNSIIAVVHMDGNNMGLRIRELLEGKESYIEAVTEMRTISKNITSSYKSVYDEMDRIFNSDNRFVLQILVAGDDITYVCTGKTALASVEYFSREISKKTMNGQTDENSLKKYGFSVCAGIAYINSHFPFSVAYDVAEACCDSAKDKAKLSEHRYVDSNITDEKEAKEKAMVGNWVDFQICKNVYSKDLESQRKKEFVTHTNEKLLIRPYELPFGNNILNSKSYEQYATLVNSIQYFKNSENIPKSYAKQLRNTYALGKNSVNELSSFLESRGHRMPDGTYDMYSEDNKARWYDALELIDDYESLDKIENPVKISKQGDK